MVLFCVRRYEMIYGVRCPAEKIEEWVRELIPWMREKEAKETDASEKGRGGS